MTFTRIHRLACQQNTLPCAPSILKNCASAEACLLGDQWISRGFTLRKVQYHQHTRSQKFHWTLITHEMREDLQIDFFLRNILWGPIEKRQYPNFPFYTAMLKYWNRLNNFIDNPIINDARTVNEDIHLSKD